MTWLLLLLGCTPADPTPPTGLIVISIDTMRADQLAAWGGPPDRTPNLNALAGSSARFTHAYAAANETLFSHGALFSGKLPSHIAPINYDFTLPRTLPTLAAAAQDSGWRTGAVVASGHLARVFGMDVGFEDYIESRFWGSFSQTVPLATQWLDRHLEGEGTDPFLLFLHSYDCHTPYTKPGPLGRLATPGYQGPLLGVLHDPLLLEKIYRGRFVPSLAVDRLTNQSNQQVLTPDIYNALRARVEAGHGTPLDQTDLDFISGLYETAVRYADMQVGVFLEALEERGLLETSTIIVLSDHGEGLMDHGFVTHRPALRDAEVHVPLLIRPPGGLPGGATIGATTSLIDVAPTALALVGLSVPGSMDGRDLSGCLRGDCPSGADDEGYAISESVLDMVSVTDGQHRLVVTEGTRTLYDARDQAVTDQAVSDRLWSALEERM